MESAQLLSNGCMTRENGLHFGLSSREPCSGKGVCVNATGLSIYFPALCLCDSMHSGECDMFDLRVAQFADGTWLSLDCPNPRIGVWTAFSIQLIVIFMRQVLLIVALIAQYRFKGSMTLKQAWAYIPYRVLLMDTVVANPLILGLPIQKLLPEGLVIGTNAGPTVCLVIGTFLGLVCFSDFEYMEFKSIVKASTLDHTYHKMVLRRQRILMHSTRASYFIFSVIPSFVALGLDKRKGPIESGEYVTLVLRNVGIIIWLASQCISDLVLQKEIRALSSSLVEANNSSGAGRNLSVLKYLEKHAGTTKKTALIGSLIWLFFSLPYFWPFQGYAMTIVTTITALRTANEGTVLLHSARIHKQSEKSTSNNRNVLAATTLVIKSGSADQQHHANNNNGSPALQRGSGCSNNGTNKGNESLFRATSADSNIVT